MEVFKWDQNFETGLLDVDRQHRQMVDIINKFGDQLTQNRLKTKDLEKISRELSAHTEQHFRDEEKLMESFSIHPLHRDRHINEHRDFMQEIAFMQKDLSQGDDSGHSLLQFHNNWLIYHLLGSDKSLSRQIAAIKAGQNAARAYEIEEQQANRSTKTLLTALDNLFQQVSMRNRQLIEMNQTLEEKVSVRTRALSEANRNLEELALTDVLTSLPNRRHAIRRLTQLWQESFAKGSPLSCLMIDADGFKTINDSCGHDAGDAVLRELARSLREAVRSDDIVCRLGGDEFLVICPDTPLRGAMHLAEITRRSVAELRVPVLGGIWHGSISIGVAARTRSMTNPDMLIKLADDGVYAAKKSGKNCIRTAKTGRRKSLSLVEKKEP